MTQFLRRTDGRRAGSGLAWLGALGLAASPLVGWAQQPQPAPTTQPVPRWQPDMTPPPPTAPTTTPPGLGYGPLGPAPTVQTPVPPAMPQAVVSPVPVTPPPDALPPEPTKPLPEAAGETLPPPPPIRPIFISKAVPRALFLTMGWLYTPSNSLPLNTTPGDMKPQTLNGLNVDGALLWQVRGFDGVSWPAWIGFMPSFYYLFGENGQRDFLGMGYGIYVKHALWPRERYRLFFAYGLGATQVWVRGVESRGIGHLTRLAVGMDVHLHKWLQLTFEFSYRFYNLPMLKLAETDSSGYDFHTLNLQAGLWFGR